jgi:hypothetical protein
VATKRDGRGGKDERERPSGARGDSGDRPGGDLGADVEARAHRMAEAATRSVARVAARAREELEDIWAEARDRRKRR